MPANETRHLETPSRQPAPTFIRAPRLICAVAVLVLGLLVSLLTGWAVKRAVDREALAAFAKVCDEVALKVNKRLNTYALLLQGGQALFAASASVERDAWRTYVETVRAEEIVPGHEGLGFSQLIQPDELAQHEAAVRAEGFPDYQVTPPHPRDIYSAIVYLEPFSGRNLRAFGHDMFSEPVRRAAMEKSRDTGRASLTGKVTLMQEGVQGVQPGALMYVPVYRNDAPTTTAEERRAALLGWVYSPYRMHDLMEGIITNPMIVDGNLINLRVYDGARPDPARLLFDSDPSDTLLGRNSILNAERTIDFHGQHWLLVFNGTNMAAGLSYVSVWLTATGGTVISGLLFGLLLAFYKRAEAQRAAEGYAEQIRDLAFYDSLTGLPNRRLLADRLTMALAAGHRQNAHGALLMLDLDKFKPLNDQHGHAAGDILLREVARRLLGSIRETDTVARLGGDEFVVLIPALDQNPATARLEATEIAEKIRAGLARPYHLRPDATNQPIEHHCSCSIGLTLLAAGESDQNAIIKRADDAMYQAKKTGHNRIAIQ